MIILDEYVIEIALLLLRLNFYPILSLDCSDRHEGVLLLLLNDGVNEFELLLMLEFMAILIFWLPFTVVVFEAVDLRSGLINFFYKVGSSGLGSTFVVVVHGGVPDKYFIRDYLRNLFKFVITYS